MKNGSFCVAQSYPPKCEEDEENFVECIRGESAPQTAKVFALILASILLCLFALLTLITCHVFSIERTLTIVPNHVQSNQNMNNRQDSGSDSNVEDFQEEENQEVNIGNVNDNQPRESLTRKSLNQSMLYVYLCLYHNFRRTIRCTCDSKKYNCNKIDIIDYSMVYIHTSSDVWDLSHTHNIPGQR